MKRVQQDGQSIRGLVTNHSLHRHTLFGAIAGLAAWYHNDSFSYASRSHNGYRCEQHLNGKRDGAWLYNDDNNALVVGSCNASVNKYYDWHNICYFDYKS